MLEIVVFVFLLIHISVVIFQVRIVTFLEKFDEWCSQVSYQGECRSELCQAMVWSLVIILLAL